MEAKLVLLALPLFLATMLAISSSSHANSFPDQNNNYIVMPHESGVAAGDLRRSSSVSNDDEINCPSWRLAVETNNLQGWKVVPAPCKYYVADYMTTNKHTLDIKVVIKAAYDYAKTVQLSQKGSDVWVLDVGQTALSLLEYYSRPDVQFGQVYNFAYI